MVLIWHTRYPQVCRTFETNSDKSFLSSSKKNIIKINNSICFCNTPGTAGGPGGRDRTLAVAKNRAKMTFFFWGKEGENNGQLRFVRHHVWRTQARLDQKKKKVSEYNGQLCIHGSCLDQNHPTWWTLMDPFLLNNWPARLEGDFLWTK